MTTTPAPRRSSLWYLWRLAIYRPWLYLAFGALEILFFAVFPQMTGFAIRGFFDRLSGGAAVDGFSPYGFAAVIVAIAAARGVAIFADVGVYFNFRYRIEALLRQNMFEHILQRPGASAVPDSPGEAVSRFRDDVAEVAFFMAESWTTIAFGVFAVASFIVMANTNVGVTLLLLIPLLGVLGLSNLASSKIGHYREVSRQAGGQVTGFIGEMFGAVMAVQANSAEAHMVQRFAVLNDTRRETAVKDRLFSELLDSVYRNMSNIGAGIVLMGAAGAMRGGEFSLGDLAIFVYYLDYVSVFIATIGEKLAWYKQVGVSFERMQRLMPDAPTSDLVRHTPVHLSGPLPEPSALLRTPADRLEALSVHALCCEFPGGEHGLHDASFELRRGEFVVITGRIGSGKTTLLRALLGLLPAEGEIRWNGQPVAKPADWFTPPRAAYTPQAPLLFSESLRDNILMGLPDADEALAQALHLAVLEPDLAAMPAGLDTPLGAKGVMLSGGQRQRAAAARALVRQPELLVIDDISSALDVDTEQTLWARLAALAGGEMTILAVSHRRPALRRADRILLLHEGRLQASGTLDELLQSNAEMRALWQGQQEDTI